MCVLSCICVRFHHAWQKQSVSYLQFIVCCFSNSLFHQLAGYPFPPIFHHEWRLELWYPVGRSLHVWSEALRRHDQCPGKILHHGLGCVLWNFQKHLDFYILLCSIVSLFELPSLMSPALFFLLPGPCPSELLSPGVVWDSARLSHASARGLPNACVWHHGSLLVSQGDFPDLHDVVFTVFFTL